MLAIWVTENAVIRRLAMKDIPLAANSIRVPIQPKPYIPEKLPPAEVGGCHFVAPIKTYDPANTIVRIVRFQHA